MFATIKYKYNQSPTPFLYNTDILKSKKLQNYSPKYTYLHTDTSLIPTFKTYRQRLQPLSLQKLILVATISLIESLLRSYLRTGWS